MYCFYLSCMKYLLLILLLGAGRLVAQTNDHYTETEYDRQHRQVADTARVWVYVCHSDDAYRYHRVYTCTGYQHCIHREALVDLAEAKRLGYTPCLRCW